MWIPYDIRASLKADSPPEAIRQSLADAEPREFLVGFFLRNPVTQAWEADIAVEGAPAEMAAGPDLPGARISFHGNDGGKLSEVIYRLDATAHDQALARAHADMQRRMLRWLVQIGVCTHLGCVPIGDGAGDMQALWAAEWVGVLKSLTAYQMYRRSLRGPVTRAGVSRFLIFSQVFPRALVYCVGEIGQALTRLPDPGAATGIVARLSSELAAAEKAGPDAARIAELLPAVRSHLSALHRAVCERYFISATQAPPSASVGQTSASRRMYSRLRRDQPRWSGTRA